MKSDSICFIFSSESSIKTQNFSLFKEQRKISSKILTVKILTYVIVSEVKSGDGMHFLHKKFENRRAKIMICFFYQTFLHFTRILKLNENCYSEKLFI